MLYGTIIVAMEAMSESFDDKILPSKMVFNDCNANFMLRDSPHMAVHVLVTEGSISPAPNSVPGPRLNIKTVLSTSGDFHVKDKTAVRTSYL